MVKRHLTLLSVAVFLLISCWEKEEALTGEDLAEVETPPGGTPSQERIEELKESLRGHEKEITKIIASQKRIGDLRKALGLRYLALGMYGPALENFSRILEINSEDANAFYNRALSYANLAKIEREKREHYLTWAEQDYRRALAIQPRLTPALYALAVLYVHEQHRPEEAEPLIERYLAIEKSDTRVRFLQAQTFLLKGDRQGALALYSEIAENAKNPQEKEAALRNRDSLLKKGGLP